MFKTQCITCPAILYNCKGCLYIAACKDTFTSRTFRCTSLKTYRFWKFVASVQPCTALHTSRISQITNTLCARTCTEYVRKWFSKFQEMATYVHSLTRTHIEIPVHAFDVSCNTSVYICHFSPINVSKITCTCSWLRMLINRPPLNANASHC